MVPDPIFVSSQYGRGNHLTLVFIHIFCYYYSYRYHYYHYYQYHGIINNLFIIRRTTVRFIFLWKRKLTSATFNFSLRKKKR